MKTKTIKTNAKTKKTKKYQKHSKLIMKKNNYTKKQKKNIAKQIFSITKEEAITDFKKLQEVGCNSKKKFSKIGNKIVNYFTSEERLETIGNKKLTFYDVWKNKNIIMREYPYVKKMFAYYEQNYKTYPMIKVWKRIYDIYYGSITIFRPLQAMEIYCRYKPTSILDFTMGWGGRLIGACALNIENYIGIDMNSRLKIPYQNMISMLEPTTKTKISVIFQDALTVDYSKLNYDIVLTSPPYYNLEFYGGQFKPMSKEEWNTKFYIPIIEKTYKYLKRGGHYCLNLPIEVYENAARKILGACTTKIPMSKFKRTTNHIYKEFIYVWKK